MAIEKASYQVIVAEGPFELRLYEPMVIAISRETDLAGGDGFNRLFNYINGNNRGSMKIAMTAPVINFLGDQQATTAFVMPANHPLEDLPQPNDPALQLREMNKRQVAAISFSGKINSAIISQKTNELQAWLREKHLITVGEISLARYNPPFVPSFIRRNELMVEIQTV